MDVAALNSLIQEIVKQAFELKNKHTDAKDAPVNYACIFSQNKGQYEELIKTAEKVGAVVKHTSSGPLFQITPLVTISGKLRLLKIRVPDITRPEMGDADFTVENYLEFKKTVLLKKGFKLVPRENFEMIELMDSKFNVRVYFSHPPLDEQLKIK